MSPTPPPANRRFRPGLFLRVALLCTLISLLSIGVGALLFLNQVEASEQARLLAEGLRLRQKLNALTIQYLNDTTVLLERCQEICRKNSGVNYITLEPHGEEPILIRSDTWSLDPVPAALNLSTTSEQGTEGTDPWNFEPVRHFAFISEIASVPWGRVTFGLSKSSHEAAKSAALHNTLIGAATCGLISILCSFLVARRITRPVASLEEMARRLSSGDLTARATVQAGGEIAGLARSMNSMADQLHSSHTLLRDFAEREHELADINAEFLACDESALDSAFRHALATTAQRLHRPAASICLLTEDNTFQRTWEWQAGMTLPPPVSRYPGDSFPWAWQTLLTDGILSLSNAAPLPPEASEERLFLERHRISSAGAALLATGGKPAGLVLFWSRESSPPWSEDDYHFLRTVAGILSNAVTRRDAARDRLLLQSQLLQSQKMEAVGKLSGGIAHDFNNMLVPIIGYSDFLLMNAPPGACWINEITEIKRAAESAASLTRQLLAFSRKQIISRSEIDLNELVLTLKKMIHRLIGENVELITRLAPDAWIIFADPGQIEQCLVNLCVNARYAIPNSGTITLRTRMIDTEDPDFTPPVSGKIHGLFVRLSVTDTGAGMRPEVLQHIFEPFYSTKGAEGTGLGLSVVHGIMEQHNGWIQVQSTLGAGTTFHLYFPALHEAPLPTAAPVSALPAALPTRGMGQTIMLVEDEAGVLAFVAAALRKNGYQVILADCGAAARRLFAERAQTIDLVMSDVVLPDASGVDLMEEFLRITPGLKILLSSGYSERTSLVDLVRTRGLSFLHKPYSLTALLDAVRDTLAGSREAMVT
jgi:signal transduction histidine kinase/CheY-like chemotaxis protein